MTSKLAKTDDRPKYRLIEEAIRNDIADGRLPERAKLPSELDMARDFGVAYTTVRQAISGLVQEGLLERIHGRGTFVLAKPPARTGTRTLALVVPSLSTLWNISGFYYLPPIVQGFSAEAALREFEPTVIGGVSDVERLVVGSPTAVTGVACLLILEEDAAVAERLRDLGIPLVCINAYQGRRAISYVAADQETGVLEAVGLLVRRGHERIAFLPGSIGNLAASVRLKGFLRAMAEYGLKPVQDRDGFQGYARPRIQSSAAGASRAQRLLELPDPPTAILAAGDMIAIGATKALEEAGVRVPEDISIIGFGDFHIARFVKPALTTIRLPLPDLGAQAVALLLRQLSGEGRQTPLTLNTEVVERETVAGPRTHALQRARIAAR